MAVFLRPWLAPSPPVVFNPLAIGIGFLVNIGYGGPIADAESASRGMTVPSLHRWPPVGLTETTPRLHIIRHVLQSAQGLHAKACEELGASIDRLAGRNDDSVFVSQYESRADEPLVFTGGCLAPALHAGDAIVEQPGVIQVGDLVTVVLRGAVLPLTKVFGGLIDREGFPAALFYLRTPEQVIEVPLADVLYARKIKAPRDFDGHSLLAEADPFVAKWRARFYLGDTMEPVGTTRTAAWVESVTSIFEVLRAQPE